MKACFENDPLRGPGYGFIRLKGMDIPKNAPLFSLRRTDESLCMTATGWQEAEERLHPDNFCFEDGALVLAVSPSVVDKLDPLQLYRLTLHDGENSQSGENPQSCALELQEVRYSPLLHGSAIAEPAAPVAPVAPAAPVAPVAPVAPAISAVSENPEVPEIPAALKVSSISETPLDMPQTPKKKTSGPWIIVACVLLCVAVGAGAWWYMQSRQTEPPIQALQIPQTAPEIPPTTQPESVAQPEKSKTDAEAEKAPTSSEPTPTPTSTSSAEAPTPPIRSAKEQVYEFMRGTGTPAEALALSKQLSTATVDDQDALFLLMEAAAENSNAEAMLVVARFYNPADASPAGTILKDPEQAFLWLNKARAVPETAPEAEKALADLRVWLQARAQNDATVKALLDQMEK